MFNMLLFISTVYLGKSSKQSVNDKICNKGKHTKTLSNTQTYKQASKQYQQTGTHSQTKQAQQATINSYSKHV